MKKVLSIISLAVALLLIGCDTKTYHWEFSQNQSQIIGLYIVDAQSPHKYEIIKEIPLDRSEELIGDITSLEYKKYRWSPHSTSGLCFVVKYQNEEYDIISWFEPMKIAWGELDGNKRLVGEFSWLKCDKDEFDILLEKYNSD